MSLIKSLKIFFGRVLRRKPAHVAREKAPKHQKPIRKKTSAKKPIRKHKLLTPKIESKKPAAEAKQRNRPQTPFPRSWLSPKKEKAKRKEEKIIYGIPESHKHETELKVAEKSTETVMRFPASKSRKRVSLRIQEKSTEQESVEPGKPKHTFFFRFREKKEREVATQKGEGKPVKAKKIKIDPKRRDAVKKILAIIESGKQKNVITTNLDLLLEIVNGMGKVKTDCLADALKLEEKDVQKLAGILEDNNLIEIHYSAFGNPELRKIEAKNDQQNSS